jgi:hypothetical protein
MQAYCHLMGAVGDSGGNYVKLPEVRFFELIREILRYVAVDEAWYRAKYGDVDAAVRAGELESGYAHYIQAGYFEDRLPRPIPVDEDWYFAVYPDVAAAIRAGAFASAAQHFERNGFSEGRLPRRGWTLLGPDLAPEEHYALEEVSRTG